QAHAAQGRAALERLPSLRDLQYAQPLDSPTIRVNIARELTGRAGATAEEVAKSLVAATSSSRFVVPNYWRDPGSGIGYQVQVEVPPPPMNAVAESGLEPVTERANQ